MSSATCVKRETSANAVQEEENLPIIVYPGFWRDVVPTGNPFPEQVQVHVYNGSTKWQFLYSGEVRILDYYQWADTTPPNSRSQRTARRTSKLEDAASFTDTIRKSSRGRKKGSPRGCGRQFSCDDCGHSFATKRTMAKHVTQEHPPTQPSSPSIANTVVPIDSVEKPFSWELVQHDLDMINKTGRRVDKKCSSCGKRFDRKGDLKRHLIEHVLAQQRFQASTSSLTGGYFECPYCHRMYDRIDTLKADLREHMNLTSYHCTICEKSFSDSSNFSKHKKVHGLSAMQCDVCRRKFNTIKMMEAHMLHHSTASPVQCERCNKIFCFESQLRKHAKAAHGAWWNHEESGLPRARNSHASPKQYSCNVCGERYPTLRDKWTHAWRAHGHRRQRADCWLCAARFRIVSELRLHLSHQHSRIYTCRQIRERQQQDDEQQPTASHSRILDYNKF